ncbi:MAG TPA: hypothetical protein VH597_03740 [Verrucomicrobiae bacterium]|jgi:hypothetical protein|nr:hypothetical protein [Verrucomicrobiae bacterium]
MKIHSFWIVAVACAMCGCASNQPFVTYDEPLISPGGEFSKLPPAVQNSVRAEAGSAEIRNISKAYHGTAIVYEITFKNRDVFPPLYLAPDGSVLTPDMRVAVGATEDTIEAATGSAVSSVKLDDLPPNVVDTIRHSAPTAELDTISRLTSGSDIFYEVTFKDPASHARLLIRDDGRLLK